MSWDSFERRRELEAPRISLLGTLRIREGDGGSSEGRKEALEDFGSRMPELLNVSLNNINVSSLIKEPQFRNGISISCAVSEASAIPR